MSRLFASGSQSIAASVSVLPKISFRIDWFDLLAVQGTLKSLLQHHGSKTSILWCSVFMVQLSHPYMTTGKTIALTRLTFVGKMMSLPFIFFPLLLFAFIFCSLYSWAISFCFFTFFCAASSSGLGTICSFSVRIIVWQGELMLWLLCHEICISPVPHICSFVHLDVLSDQRFYI